MKRIRRAIPASLALVALTALPAAAQDATLDEQVASLGYDLDVVWVAVATALVFLMQAGFSLVEAGLTRAKNAGNIVAKNLADMSIGALSYWAIGAALAYGATAGGLFGTSGFFFDPGAEGAVLGGDGIQFMFQLVFAATAATIVSGAVAGRMKFAGYLVISLVITGFVYPIVSHWQWGGGWLSEAGYYDFAGSSIVHMTGGIAALVGAAILGPRIGKYGKDGKPRAIPGHSIPLAMTGVFILWFGWFGFNGGSTLAAQGQGQAIGAILTTTTLAAAAGAVLAGAVIWIVARKPDPAMAGNGALAGLVGITAGPDLATGLEAVLVGAFCGAIVVGSVMLFDRIRIDDPVGAISVHGTCGIIGTLAVGVYTNSEYSLATQALGVVSIAAFVAAVSALAFYLVKFTIGIRVTEEEEIEGLDITEHGVYGYPDVVLGPSGAAGFSSPPTPAPAPTPSTRPAME